MTHDNVDIPPGAAGDAPDRGALTAATGWLAEILSPHFPECHARWEVLSGPGGKAMYRLRLETPWGEGETEFTPETLASSVKTRLALYRLVNAILKDYNHRMLAEKTVLVGG